MNNSLMEVLEEDGETDMKICKIVFIIDIYDT